MLPSMQSFLALWDDPVEFVEIRGNHTSTEFRAIVVIEAPSIPPLKITMQPMRMGES